MVASVWFVCASAPRKGGGSKILGFSALGILFPGWRLHHGRWHDSLKDKYQFDSLTKFPHFPSQPPRSKDSLKAKVGGKIIGPSTEIRPKSRFSRKHGSDSFISRKSLLTTKGGIVSKKGTFTSSNEQAAVHARKQHTKQTLNVTHHYTQCSVQSTKHCVSFNH